MTTLTKLCFKCVFFFSIISCQRKLCWGNCSDVENLCQTFKSFSLFLYSVYFIISGQIFFLLLSEEILLSDRKQFFFSMARMKISYQREENIYMKWIYQYTMYHVVFVLFLMHILIQQSK